MRFLSPKETAKVPGTIVNDAPLLPLHPSIVNDELAVSYFLRAIQLAQAIYEPDKTRILKDYAIYRIKVDDFFGPFPAQGLKILQQELARVPFFDILMTNDHKPIGIFPVGGDHFYDLTDYYVPVRLLQQGTLGDSRKEWVDVLEEIRRLKDMLGLFTGNGTWGQSINHDQKSYLYGKFDTVLGRHHVQSFDPNELQNEEFYERMSSPKIGVLPSISGES